MKPTIQSQFWRHFRRLPANVQRTAAKQLELWSENPRHPSLQFKKTRNNLWSIRITQNYRAVAERVDNEMVWFWIGPHHEYDQLLRRRR